MPNPLFDALLAIHRENHDVFLIPDAGNPISYRRFVERAGQFAAALKASGIVAGDRVALQLEKSPDALAVCCACIQLGAVFLPLNTAYTAAEVEYFLADSGAKLFICTASRASEAEGIASKLGTEMKTLDTAGGGSLAELAETLPPLHHVADRSDDDLAALLYTSGTTGRSKGAMLTQLNLLSNARTLAHYWAFTKDDVLLHALPIFHTHGLFVATNTVLLTGGKMRFYNAFSNDALIEDMPKATAMMGVPTFYTRLLNDPKFTRETAENMRLFISGSAPMLTETHVQFKERTGHQVLERYGMTETSMSTSNPYDDARKPGTVGLPLPEVELKITDPATGEAVTQGEIGQIEVRGPNVFKGYWNMPEKTAEELRTDGFFITGDLAMMDADGFVTIVGREKDLIISGGYNVYPKEVEAALDDHPDVLESAVIGVPHPDLGEAVVAVLVAAEGVEIDGDQVLASLKDNLARFKQPRRVVVLEALPRNTMGKVQKAEMRKTYASTFI